MKIVVLGGGRVGSAMARDLARDPRFTVTVVDASAEALGALRETGIATARADFADPAAVARAVEGHDLVVGAVPGFLGFATLKAVLEAGKDIVDISFFDEDPFLLDDLAASGGGSPSSTAAWLRGAATWCWGGWPRSSTAWTTSSAASAACRRSAAGRSSSRRSSPPSTCSRSTPARPASSASARW